MTVYSESRGFGLSRLCWNLPLLRYSFSTGLFREYTEVFRLLFWLEGIISIFRILRVSYEGIGGDKLFRHSSFSSYLVSEVSYFFRLMVTISSTISLFGLGLLEFLMWTKWAPSFYNCTLSCSWWLVSNCSP